MPRYAIALIAVVFATISIPIKSADEQKHSTQVPGTSQFEDKLNKRVGHFDASGRTLVKCLLDLAYEYQLPLALEYVEDKALDQQLVLELRDQTLRGVLLAVVRNASGYQLSIAGGIVDVYAPRARENPANLLNKLIKNFSVSSADTHFADAALFCTLSREIEPSSACVGSIVPGQWGTKQVSVHMQNARVYEILNAIISENGSAIWTVTVPPADLSKTPIVDLWHIYPLQPEFKQLAFERLKGLASRHSPVSSSRLGGRP